jgi:hypothetical protein
MKVEFDINNNFIQLQPDNYELGNYKHTNYFIQITSYASDIDMKDVQENQAWKFKIVDGELQYDQDKIKTKLNSDVIAKRVQRYQSESDPLVLEGSRTNNEALIAQANIKVNQIKQDLPKV